MVLGTTDRNCRLLLRARGSDSSALWFLRTGVPGHLSRCPEGVMELLHERCAALDIGKKDLKACVRSPNSGRRRLRQQEIRTFATTTNALLELRDWLGAGEGPLGG